jgi:hypothetical protein
MHGQQNITIKEELHNMYCSPNIIRVMKSGRMRWAENVARIRRRDVHTGFWWGNPKEGAGPREGVRVPVKQIFRAPQRGRTGKKRSEEIT